MLSKVQFSNVHRLRTHYDSYLAKKIRQKVKDAFKSEQDPDSNHVDLERALRSEQLASGLYTPLRYLVRYEEDSPNKVLFSCKGRDYTASEILSEAKKVACGLKELGLKKGDNIALGIMPDDPETQIISFAAQMIGVTTVPLNFAHPEEKVIPKMLMDAGASILVIGRDLRLRKGADLLSIAFIKDGIKLGPNGNTKNSGFFAELSQLGRLSIENIIKAFLMSRYNTKDFRSYESLKSGGKLQDEMLLNPPSELPIYKLFTSGTTSLPKLITTNYHTLAKIVESMGSVPDLEVTDKSSMLGCFGPSHVAFKIVENGSLHKGASMVLATTPTNEDPQTIKNVLDLIEREAIDIFPGAPKFISNVLEKVIRGKAIPSIDSLCVIFSGGAPVSPELLNQIGIINDDRKEREVKQITLVDFLATTETGPILCNIMHIGSRGTEIERKVVSKQIVFPGVELKLQSLPDEADVQELLVKPISFSQGIPPEKIVDGYYKTGDRFQQLSDGTYKYASRLVDVANKGGKKIPFAEIENTVRKLIGDKVKDVYVFSLQGVRGDDYTPAVIVLKPGCNLTSDGIKEILERRCEQTKLPKRFLPEVVLITTDKEIEKLQRVPGKIPSRMLRNKFREAAEQQYELYLVGKKH